MANISHAFIFSLFMLLSFSYFITPNNAELHIFSHSLPYTAPTPTPAPAPSPSHHHHHHTSHRHAHSPSTAPVSAPAYKTTSPPPAKPVVPPPTPAVKPPTYPTPSPPTKPPTQPPVKPPTYPPVNPPSSAPPPYSAPEMKRKFVAVQGVVYCKNNCSYSGIKTLMGASPLAGATLVMRCRNTKYLLRKTATTDKNGYFFLQAPHQITTYGAHKCIVYLARKQNSVGPCSHATDFNGGASGAFLYLNKTAPPQHLPTFTLFTVGPFAFESTKCYKH